MQVVFNECSLRPSRSKNVHEAREWMRQMLSVLREVRSAACDEKVELRVHAELRQMEIMKGYFFGPYLNDLNMDERRAFLTLATRRSYIPNVVNEFKYRDKITVIGLGYAALEDLLAIGFASRPRWNRRESARIALIRYELDPTGGNIIKTACEARYVCHPSHFAGFVLKWSPSPKHAPSGRGTPMDLDDATAQRVLNCSVQIAGDKQRYGYYSGKLYEFQPDGVGGYHGYPIKMVDLRQAGKHKQVLDLLLAQGAISQHDYAAWI